MTKSLTTLIGRFSLFHNGHAHLINRAIEGSDFLLILIGSSNQVRTIKNPFTFEERAEVIETYIKSQHPNAVVRINPQDDTEDFLYGGVCPGIIIKPLHDHIYNDLEWINEVQENVIKTKKILPIHQDSDVYLTGADRDESTWYLKAFGDFFRSDLITESPYSLELNATALRDQYFESKGTYSFTGAVYTDSHSEFLNLIPEQTVKFLAKFAFTEEMVDLLEEHKFIKKYKDAWKSAPYAPIFVTVDTCVIQSGHILVNVRDNYPGRGLWALPGGFLEQDETLLDGAIRELIEETSIGLAKAQLYGSVKSQKVFDSPGRSLRGRTITHCFLLKLDDSKPLPKVKPQKGEVKHLMWLPITEALSNTDKWFDDHHDMVSWSVKECARL